MTLEQDFKVIELFASKRGWKFPIAKSVPLRKLAEIIGSNQPHDIERNVREAIIRCTGSVPTITVVRDKLRAEAAGYYAAIGM